MENQLDNTLIVACHCGDRKDHVLHVDFDDDEQYSTVTANMALNHYLGPWRRLVVAVKYLFGIDNTYYHYVETVIPDEDVEKLALWFTEKAKLLNDRKGLN